MLGLLGGGIRWGVRGGLFPGFVGLNGRIISVSRNSIISLVRW